MSFYIDTSTPDLANFDPERQGTPLPPVGNYTGVFQVVGSEQGQTKSGDSQFIITFEALDGEIAKTLFKLYYNSGHSNPDYAKWAIEDILRVVYAVTGIKNHGRGFQFDDKMNYKPFNATLVVSIQKDKNGSIVNDDKGNPRRQAKFNALKPIESGQPQQAQYNNPPAQQAQYNNPPAQQAQYNNPPAQTGGNNGQPQSDKPSWANR